MYVMSVADVLSLSELKPHAAMLEKGMIVQWSEGMDVIFVSHQWLSRGHPDPEMKQFKVLQLGLQNIIAGRCRLDTHALSVLDLGKDEVVSKTECEALAHAYVWYDYFGVPQLSTSYDPHAGENLMKAVNSIPDYVAMCQYFFVLCPDCKHQAGHWCNYLSWSRRGWCKMEELARRLTHFNKMVVVVRGGCQAELFDSQDFWCHPVGLGQFSCCEMNHVCDGCTIPCDKIKILPVVQNMLDKLRTEKLKSKDVMDLFFFRLITSLTPGLLAGLPHEAAASTENVDEFYEDLHIRSTPGPEQCLCATWSQSFEDTRAGPGWGPLFFAVLFGNFHVATSLLRRGTPIDQRSTADVSGILLARGSTPLLAASFLSGSGEAVRFLVEMRADINLKNANDANAMMYAAWGGHVANVEALLNAGLSHANVGTNGLQPLMCAASFARADVVQCLVHAGADMNARVIFGPNSLCAAGQSNDLASLKLLLDMRADPNHKCLAQTAEANIKYGLMTIANRVAQPRIFIDFIANLRGSTPIHIASMMGSTSCVEELIKRRADLQALNALGKTPLDLALHRGHDNVREVLCPVPSP